MMNEDETRLLIDEQLRKVGWDADSKNLCQSKGTRPQRGKNIAIAEWKTDSGFADYALFCGLKLVGLIEAKSQHKNISAILDFQCKDYAKNIRKEDEKYLIGTWNGFRVPFIFATNGRNFIPQFEIASGIWFQDLRISSNAPKALRGWISPEGILKLLERNIPAANENLQSMTQNFLTDDNGLNLRQYQINAIHAVENAVINGQKNILIAMATGTGKTRTILAMIYRFLKSGRFRRILFLVDRNSLGEQAQDVFNDIKIEDFLPLNKIYNVAKLGENFVKETRVQVATVQSMVKRVIYNEDNFAPAVTDYDLIIVDEAHRGYILDKDFSDDEIIFTDQQDYQSKYRRVIDYFDAVKIALTATPALHTVEIFGKPVFKYSYREAVLDGYLVDYDPPHILKTTLSKNGIHYKKGDIITFCNSSTGEIKSELLADELNFEIENFNRQVVNENFNRVVLEEISKFINPDGAGKTLIFAVDDLHADLIVKILKEIYTAQGVSNDAVLKITGSVGYKKQVSDVIKRFKNEKFPNIVVTVDLLTTGIDVPKIDTLVFLRRVKSRILFEQMLGRATRLCPEIGKTHFQIFDAVGVFESIQSFSDMKPVISNPAETFKSLLDKLKRAENSQIPKFISQIVAKLQRVKFKLSPQNLEHFINLAGKSPNDFISHVKNLQPVDAKNFLLQHFDLFKFLQEKSGRNFVISEHEDELTEHVRGYGEGKNPQDYIDSFIKFINANKNEIAALNIVCTRPKDLKRADLKSLRSKLQLENFNENQLNAALSQMTNSEIAADIISFIRRYTLGSKLLNHDDKIISAVNKLKAAHNFNQQELQWINRIEKYLLNESVINLESFDEDKTAFKMAGGFKRIDKAFNGNLANIIAELNFYLYDDGGNVA